jgi:hypothetical protein
MPMSKRTRRLVMAGTIAASYAIGTVVAVRRGYSFGRSVPVRCQRGHLFATVWIPGASVKSLRLGLWRAQWCPVGQHFALVRLVKYESLSEAQRTFVGGHHDLPVP